MSKLKHLCQTCIRYYTTCPIESSNEITNCIEYVKKDNECSTAAIASFICGLIGFLLLPSIPAILFGHIALHDIKYKNMKGKVIASIGLVLGYIFFAYLLFVLILAYISVKPSSLDTDYAKNLRAKQRQITYTKSPKQYKTIYRSYPKFKPPIINNKNNLYDKILNAEIAIGKENHGNFIYGVGMAGLKYLITNSGINKELPNQTLNSKSLTNTIEGAGFTPKTNYNINNLID
jgi:hypothetical protein